MKKSFFLFLLLILPLIVGKAQKPVISLVGTHVSTCDVKSDSTYGEWADWLEFYTTIKIDRDNNLIKITGSEEMSYKIIERAEDTVEEDVTYATFRCIDDNESYYEIQLLIYTQDDGSKEIQEMHVYGEKGGRAYKVERWS